MNSLVRNIKINKNPFILFLPFLILYILLILIFSENEIYGDEGRYLMYAQNLLQGFYSPPPPDIDLGNGPGYPLVLVPFVAFHLPIIYIKLLNAVFYYLSVILLFKSLQQTVSSRLTIIFSLAWALYPTVYEQLIHALPEVFTSSLIPLLIFTLLKTFENDIRKRNTVKYIFFAGLTFGYIALTKPIFGYVIMFMIMGVGLLWLINKRNALLKKSMSVLIIAFITTIPYLAYTYNLTGRIFYWSSFGGNNLYWMSTPYEEEYGNWMAYPVSQYIDGRIPGSEEIIKLRHQRDFEEIIKSRGLEQEVASRGIEMKDVTTGLEQDDILKRIAIQNIKSNPLKFVKNCISNAGRMIFNYPYSYAFQRPSTLQRLPINGIIMVLTLFCLIPTFVNWQKILFPMRFLLFVALLYFSGSLLGSAEARMFTKIIPILFIWIACILQKTVKINLVWENNK